MVTLPVKILPKAPDAQTPITVHSIVGPSHGLQTQSRVGNQDTDITTSQPTAKVMKISYTGEMQMISRPIVKTQTVVRTIGSPTTSIQANSGPKAAITETSSSSQVSKKLAKFIMSSLKESFKVSKMQIPFIVKCGKLNDLVI